MVGNESLQTGNVTEDRLIQLIQRAKKSSHARHDCGKLGRLAVDIRGLSRLSTSSLRISWPYWGGTDASTAVDQTIDFYGRLRQAYPGKRIVIAEFGWPSAGYNFHNANPGTIEQAMIVRDFANWAQAYGIDYNIIEGIDQPWKTTEGGVGPYWGLLDTSHHPKFAWSGPITDSDYMERAGFAVLLGVLLSLPILAIAGVTATQAAMLGICANLLGAWVTAIIAFWKGHYFVTGAALALGLGVVLLMPLIAIALSRLDEIAAIACSAIAAGRSQCARDRS